MILTQIVLDGKVVGNICSPGPMVRTTDELHGDPRWCFKCRKVREFRFTVDKELEPSYYGPNCAIRCGTCGTNDGDCFPGWSRSHEED